MSIMPKEICIMLRERQCQKYLKVKNTYIRTSGIKIVFQVKKMYLWNLHEKRFKKVIVGGI